METLLTGVSMSTACIGTMLIVVVLAWYRRHSPKAPTNDTTEELETVQPEPDGDVRDRLVINNVIIGNDKYDTYGATIDNTPMEVKVYHHVPPDEAARVRDEVQVMTTLMANRHRNVIDVLIIQDGAMPVIGLQPTDTFTDLFTLRPLGQTLPTNAVRTYIRQLCEALGHVHSLNIIHLDVKPENVFVNDVGLVKLNGFDSSHPRLDGVSLRGSPQFMAPELLRQVYSKEVDWWALGCLASEVLTTRTPFSTDSVEALMFSILHGEIVVPPVGPGEHAFILALLTRDPRLRLGANGHEEVLGHAWLA